MKIQWIQRIGSPGGALVLGCAGLMALGGCGRKPRAAAPADRPPPEVGVVTVATGAVAVKTELPGRLDAVRVAEVRARATGILLKRTFDEGADVQAGEVLFRIDPAPLKAVYDSARANLAKAEATLSQAETVARRYGELVVIDAVSRQDYDNAKAAVLEDKANVEAARAAVETASLNLGYATVTAPISGRIGAARVTEGALVSATDATEMAVIQQLDPIYFDFTQSSTAVLRLRRELKSGKLKSLAPGQAAVTLILSDGTVYPHPGKLLFSDITVDPTTGMVTLRAVVPNPEHLLLPGMFARGELEEGIDEKGVTVSQRAVTFGPDGSTSVLLVDAEDKVEQRAIQVGSAVGSNWVVRSGLQAGDRVIVDGLQKVRPGIVVKAVPFRPVATADSTSGSSRLQAAAGE